MDTPQRPPSPRQALGRWGEDLAVRHLESVGFVVLARNWRCAAGELDVIARDGATVVFVEVKTRSGTGFGDPVEAVTHRKAARLRLLALRWLAEQRPAGAAQLRFDVVGIVRRPGEQALLRHIRGIF